MSGALGDASLVMAAAPVLAGIASDAYGCLFKVGRINTLPNFEKATRTPNCDFC